MKFSELYPDMKPIVDEEEGIIRGKNLTFCCMCGELTPYIDICSEAHFCSRECLHKFYSEFMESLAMQQDVEEEF